jgi:hypothetical protein
MAIWVLKERQREGPYEEQDIRELVYEGTYSDSDPAIRDGQLDWSTVGQVLGRQSPTTKPPPVPAPAPATAVEPVIPSALPPELPPPPPYPAVESGPATPAVSPEAPAPPAATTAPQPMKVTVIDFDMPFGSMVMLMVKWVLASIPALLILGAIGAIFWVMVIAIVSMAFRH